MKNPNKNAILFSLVISMVLFGKCSLLDWNINGELSTTFEVNEMSEDVDIQYSSTAMLSADSDDDVRGNLSKIKDWSVIELSYSVRNFEVDPAVTFSAEVGFSKSSASSASFTASFSEIIFSEITDDRRKYIINLSESQLDTMSTWLDEDHVLKVYIDGIISEGPAEFDLKIHIDIRVKVKGL